MALRYITGRSGQGKTEYLVERSDPPFYRDSGKNNIMLLYRNQVSLEMQRKIVKMHPRHGFF